MTKRLLLATAVAIVLATAVWGIASTLGGIRNQNLGAEDAVVASCDTDGVSVAYVLAAQGTTFVIQTVNVTGIADPCVGKTLTLFLSANGQTIAGTLASVPVTAGTANNNNATAPLPTPPPAKNVDGIHIAIQ